MELEIRYIILKNKDVTAYLTIEEQEQLDDLCRKINRCRLMESKVVLQGLVVEHAWPEYGPTLGAISRRVDRENCLHKWVWWPVVGEGQVCDKCGERNFDCDD